MFALASRFSPQPHLSSFRNIHAWRSLLTNVNTPLSCPGSVVHDLNVVKKECLTTIFEYGVSPGPCALMQAGVMTRAALAQGLHRIDDRKYIGDLPQTDLEERRYVWWLVWQLETMSNGITMMPPGTDNSFVKTFMVSTSIEEFTNGLTGTCSQTPLNGGIQGFRTFLAGVRSESNVAMENVKLYIVWLLRETHAVHCRSVIHLSTQDYDRLSQIREACYLISSCYPDWFLNPSRRQEKYEKFSEHRQRLGCLLEFNMYVILTPLKCALC